MLDKVITHYLNELDVNKLVYSKMKLTNMFFWIVIVLSMVFALVLLFINPIFEFAVLVFDVVFFLFFNWRIKKVIYREYRIPQKMGLWETWGGEEYQEYVQARLFGFLEQNRINNSSLIEKLIARLSKRIEEMKIVVYFVPGVFFGFMIPTWAAYNTTILFKEKSYEEAAQLLIVIFLCLVIVAFFSGMMKDMLSEIILTRRRKLSKLLDFLHDIQLEYLLKEDTNIAVNNDKSCTIVIRNEVLNGKQRVKSSSITRSYKYE